MKILVDTSIIIDFLRSREKQSTAYFRTFFETENSAYISFVTMIELYAGKSIANQDQRALLEELLETVEILESDTATCIKAGEILRSHTISFQDAVIAAQSINASLRLMTYNKKDFIPVTGIRLLEI
jgi:predicted nucleic acid-binding protein